MLSKSALAVTAWQVYDHHSRFSLNIKTEHQILRANPLRDFEIKTEVDPFSGRAQIQQMDFHLPLPDSLYFPLHRIYSIESGQSQPLGPGWRWAFDISLRLIDDNQLELFDFDGNHRLFHKSNKDSYVNQTFGLRTIYKTSFGYEYTIKQNNYRFNQSGRLTSISDPVGNKVKFDYQNNLLVKIDLFGWQTIEFEHDEQSRLARIVLPSGNSVHYDFNGMLLSQAIDQFNNEIAYDYAEDSLSAIKYGGNTILQVEQHIDQNNLLVSLTPLGSYRIQYRFQSFAQGEFEFTVEQITDDETVLTQLGCIADECSLTDPMGAISRINWHGKHSGLPVYYRSAEGRETNWTYDVQGKLISVRKGDVWVNRLEYDDKQRLVSLTSPRGVKTVFEYTQNGLLAQTRQAGIITGKFSYNQYGLLKTLTNQAGQTVTFQYDEQLIPATVKLNFADLKLKYDGMYRNTKIIVNKVPVFNIAYSDKDKTINYTSLMNTHSQQTHYSSAGLLMGLNSMYHGDLKFEYDSSNRLSAVKNTTNQSLMYRYDAFGRLHSAKAFTGERYSFNYDQAGRLRRISDDSATILKAHEYDKDGLKTSEMNADQTAVHYKYDALGRLSAVQHGDQTVTEILYNADNYPIQLTHKSHVINYFRDGLNRIKLMRIEPPDQPQPRDYEFEWNPQNQLAALIYPSGTVIKYNYDSKNRLLNVNLNDQASIGIEYEGPGELLMDYGSGVRTGYSLNHANNLYKMMYTAGNTKVLLENDYNKKTQLVSKQFNIRKADGTHSSTTLSRFKYDWKGRLTEIRDKDNRFTQYYFDEYNRINQIRNNQQSEHYFYDKNKLTGTQTRKFTYDENKRLKAVYDQTANIEFFYDPQNRLESILSGSFKIDYLYDGNGQRISRTMDEFQILYDNYNNVRLAEYGVKAKQREYIYTPDFKLPLAFADVLQSEGNKTDSRDWYFLHRDELRNVALITDNTGKLLNYYRFDPNGKELEVLESIDNNLRYQSRFRDELTNFYPMEDAQYSTADVHSFKQKLDLSLVPELLDDYSAYLADRPGLTRPSSGLGYSVLPDGSGIVDLNLLIEKSLSSNSIDSFFVSDPYDQDSASINYTDPLAQMNKQIIEQVLDVLNLTNIGSENLASTVSLEEFVQNSRNQAIELNLPSSPGKVVDQTPAISVKSSENTDDLDNDAVAKKTDGIKNQAELVEPSNNREGATLDPPQTKRIWLDAVPE